MKRNKKLEQDIADVIMGRPYGFSVKKRHYYLYPVTIGKLLLLQRQIELLEINQENMKKYLSLETLRLAREKRDICLNIITYHTCRNKREIFDYQNNKNKKYYFDKFLKDEEIASLIEIVFQSDKTEMIMNYLGISKEQDDVKTITRIKNKNNKNTINIGGKSQFGSLIDTACERYGWTKDYVVWEIDYSSLKIMLADKLESIFVTDEELKKIPYSIKNKDEDVIKPTKENMEEILKMNWK